MNRIINKKFLLFFIPIVSIVYYYFELKTKHTLYFKEYFIFSIFISLIIILSIYILKKKNIKLDETFLVIGLILGSIYIFSSPLFTGGDEYSHYYRIYEISKGTLVTPTKAGPVGSMLPESLYKTFAVDGKCKQNCSISIKYSDIKSMVKLKLNKRNEVRYGYGYKTLYVNTSLHSFVPYIFQAIGFAIGRALNINPYYIGIIGRFFNLISYLAICYVGLKKLPKHKLMFMILLLSPTLLSTACTLNADALTNGMIFLFIASVMNIYYGKEKINRKDMILLLVLSAFIGASKIVYLPITFLAFLIPHEKFDNKKNKYIYCIEVVLLSAIIDLIWLQFIKPYMDKIYIMTEIQEKMILEAPFNYIKVLCITFVKEFFHLTTSVFAGTDMYHAQILINPIVSAVLIVLFIAALFNDESPKKVDNISKIAIFLIMLIVSVLICTAIYVQFNANFFKLNNSVIKGLQGRYFIPIFMLFSLVINKKVCKLDDKILLYILVLLHIPVYLTMFIRFIA